MKESFTDIMAQAAQKEQSRLSSRSSLDKEIGRASAKSIPRSSNRLSSQNRRSQSDRTGRPRSQAHQQLSRIRQDPSFLFKTKDSDLDRMVANARGESLKSSKRGSGLFSINKKPTQSSIEAGLNEKSEAFSQASFNTPSSDYEKSSGGVRIRLFSIVVFLVGVSSVVFILVWGIQTAKKDQERNFQRQANFLVHSFDLAHDDIFKAGLWIHQAASHHLMDDGTLNQVDRDDFHELFRNLDYSGVAASSIGFCVNVSQEERVSWENETREVLKLSHPDYEYPGFIGFENRTDSIHNNRRLHGSINESASLDEVNYSTLGPRSEQPFYMVNHLIEPFLTSAEGYHLIDLDVMTMPSVAEAVNVAVDSSRPTVTSPQHVPGTDSCRFVFVNPGMPHHESHGMAGDHQHDIIQDNEGTEPSGNQVSGKQHNTEENSHGRQGFSLMYVLIPSIFEHVAQMLELVDDDTFFQTYIYDDTDVSVDPMFIASANFEPWLNDHHRPEVVSPYIEHKSNGAKTTSIPPLSYHEATSLETDYKLQIPLTVANRHWTFVIVASKESFSPDYTFIVIGASMIFVACISITFWLCADYRRLVKINQVKAASEAEKASLMVKSARVTARKERELNDFIAHEVRNPLSAALSACSFVSSAIQAENAFGGDQEKKETVEEDVSVIVSSLSFINDLLRNMLDMHRANSNQLQLNPTHTDVLSDILQPVAAMLYRRGENFKVEVECESDDMVIMADKLRLKQIVMNLGRNAVKFVTKGFVRLRAARDLESGYVRIFVEDSGPGIPLEKRSRLFSKFQESLDSLHQGTGIGLAVCRQLIDLMGGDIHLDETYDSGIDGYPGACFVISLNVLTVHVEDSLINNPPEMMEEVKMHQNPSQFNDESTIDTSSSLRIPENENPKQSHERPSVALPTNSDSSSAAKPITAPTTPTEDALEPKLPEKLSVLFVDDDMMIRKLFIRSLKRVVPEWDCQQASSGELGLQMAKEKNFDLIFLDQYMAGPVKQMLGTETCVAMRAANVMGGSQQPSIICGLSANDLEEGFKSSGATSFMMKPFPCAPKTLRIELSKLLELGNRHESPREEYTRADSPFESQTDSTWSNEIDHDAIS